MTAHDLVSWLRWADQGATESEKKERTARVWKQVFPENLDFIEKSKREAIVDYVKKIGEPPSWEGWPDPRPPSETVPDTKPPEIVPVVPMAAPSLAASTWEGLISRSSPAFKRGSLHDGTLAEIERMREVAKGSPFDADESDRPRAREKRKRDSDR